MSGSNKLFAFVGLAAIIVFVIYVGTGKNQCEQAVRLTMPIEKFGLLVENVKGHDDGWEEFRILAVKKVLEEFFQYRGTCDFIENYEKKLIDSAKETKGLTEDEKRHLFGNQ